MYDPAANQWTNTEYLMQKRRFHTATRLLDGRVLVTGGDTGTYDNPLRSAELYDPQTGHWTTAGNMLYPRVHHTATLLASGKVLVVGGYNGSNWCLDQCEVYDPADGPNGTWSPAGAGTLAQGRASHTATRLADGKVLVTGGWYYTPGDGTIATCEVYDAGTGSWTGAGVLDVGKEYHTATLLPDGRVLVTGGIDYSYSTLKGCRIGTPPEGGSGLWEWTSTGNMLDRQMYHSASLLPDGTVLVTGGLDDVAHVKLSSCEIFDPSQGMWTPTDAMSTPRLWHTTTLLDSGLVLTAAGENASAALDTAEVYGIGNAPASPCDYEFLGEVRGPAGDPIFTPIGLTSRGPRETSSSTSPTTTTATLQKWRQHGYRAPLRKF